MSCLFGNLVAVRRGEERLYCLLEARVKLFPNTEDHRLSYAMSFLGMNTLACTESEISLLERTLPPQFAPFQLVSEQHLLRLHRLLLLDFSEVESNTPSTFNSQFPFATNQRAEFSVPGISLKSWHVQSGVEEEQKNATFEQQCNRDNNSGAHCEQSAPRLESVICKVDSGRADGRQLAKAFSSVEGECDEIGQSGENSPEDSCPSTEVSKEKKDKKTGVTLSEGEMSAGLRSELSEIRKFYSDELNCNREGTSLQSNTIDKMMERTSVFLWFLKNVKNLDPALIHCSNPELVQEFVQFMMDRRGVKPITCSRYITALINVRKVPLDSYGSLDKEASSEVLEKVRAVQRQLERLARKEKVDALGQKPELEKVVYPEILELCRELKWEVHEKSGSAQARSCMNLCLLLLYCAANPGRAKEYVTLQIYRGQTADQSKNQNLICFNEDGSVILFEDDYKTRSTYGPNRTDLTALPFLTYYLKLYCSKLRPLLLCGKEHDYFFVSPRGDPFSQASYGNYITALFEQYFNLKVTTVDIRKAVVNYFLTLPQSGDYSLRESFATLMKHSVRAQKRYYDERPLAQKKSRALDLLGSVASRSLGEGSVEVLSDEDEQLNLEILPAEGEFVALVAANSTKSVPEVFVARVLRVSDDRRTAYLAEFSEELPGKFKLTAGKSYKEAVNALIYPIDIVYLHSSGVYELRTSKLEIHQQVYKK